MPASRYCCPYNCSNSEQKNPELTFYAFPEKKYEIERKNRWIQAVKRITADKKPWKPKSYTRICSAHFVGGKKSNIATDEAYIPTIFPMIYKKKVISVNRKKRLQKRKARLQLRTVSPSVSIENNIEIGISDAIKMPTTHESSCQTDPCLDNVDSKESADILFCWNGQNNDASTQTCIIIKKPQQMTKVIIQTLEKFYCSKKCGPDTEYNPGFSGFSDITSDRTMRQLGGVSLNFFHVLLNLLCRNEDGQPAYYEKLNKENRLLLFLIKMKLGISFCALGCLFHIHSSTASSIFYKVLKTLAIKTKSWIFWPSKESVKRNLPAAFQRYPNCRCIIDCTEIFTDTPPTVEQRILMYSNYKSRFTVKYLIVITPDGFVCKVSKGYGGRATDSFITNDSGFLNLIEPGDLVLADKGFPQIKSELSKRNGTLVIPPFAFNPQFTADEIEETYKIASVRIHVERAIQRVKLCQILKHIFNELLPYIDTIMHMCCVIANSGPPLFRELTTE